MRRNEQIRTRIKKRLFIEYYKKFLGSIKATCDKIEIERKTYYNWKKKDPEFELEVRHAFREILEDLEDMLKTLVLQGDGPSIRFYLSRRHPDFMRK